MFKYIIKVNVGVGANGPAPRGGGYRLAFALALACPVGRLSLFWLVGFPLAYKRFASGFCGLSVSFQSSLFRGLFL